MACLSTRLNDLAGLLFWDLILYRFRSTGKGVVSLCLWPGPNYQLQSALKCLEVGDDDFQVSKDEKEKWC